MRDDADDISRFHRKRVVYESRVVRSSMSPYPRGMQLSRQSLSYMISSDRTPVVAFKCVDLTSYKISTLLHQLKSARTVEDGEVVRFLASWISSDEPLPHGDDRFFPLTATFLPSRENTRWALVWISSVGSLPYVYDLRLDGINPSKFSISFAVNTSDERHFKKVTAEIEIPSVNGSLSFLLWWVTTLREGRREKSLATKISMRRPWSNPLRPADGSYAMAQM
ncbi:hypothetical protein ARMGADRAFT_1168276 [Armillaria gallica]|uniref:Uncharacterized protein n=1 Tax=Armillaria gallica TaxID=47427 RepID=A0A2H3CYL7_ARMGA|nr:hypothetical protein ARMGADRAFT_1168276 [Armillaria gallica]